MSDDENAVYEAEVLRLWDELPDHAKTPSLLDKIKDICPEAIMRQLATPENNLPVLINDNSVETDD